MLEERNLKVDLFALALLALTIFLAAALLSYDRADPPSGLVFPERAETLNICGPIGAAVSRLLFGALGLGAFYLLVSLGALDVVMLTRREVGQPVLRTAGWLISLVGITTLAAMATPGLSPGPVIGSGGYLGAAGRGVMEMNFASVGAYILTLSLIFAGLLLCTDYVLVQLFGWLIGKPVNGLGRGVLCVGAAYAQKLTERRSRPDASETEKEGEYEEHEEEAEDEAEPSVPVVAPQGGKKSGKPKAKKETKAKQKDTATSPRNPLASMLRIKKPKKGGASEALDQLDTSNEGADASDYELPSIDLLLESEAFSFDQQEEEVREKAKILERTFANFGFNIRVVEIQTGPVIAQFEVELEAGLRLSKITGLADDLAIALRVPAVRIVAPIPGKNTVGVEVPNNERQLVRLREVMEESEGKAQAMRIPIYVGKDVAGNAMVVDLASLPHLLIAGRTGTGKSVCLNSIIASILMTRRPDEVRLLLIDPKMVELSPYKQLPHLMHPVVTDMHKAEAILAWAVEKMEERYQLLARAGVRHISAYNQLGREEILQRIQPENEEDAKGIPSHIPYVVIVADEIADLMMTAAKEVEGHIIRLAQKSRAVGIHLVLATQKPTVDVITGLIKSNLPARIAFQVASRTDSRVVLDEMGADRLLGDGDLLFLWPGTSTLIRGQGTYLCDDEISRIIAKVATAEPHFIDELVLLKTKEDDGTGASLQLSNRDDLYEGAVDVVLREGRGSVSLLQRSLGIGYGRAARLIDYMAEDGIVGPYNGSQAREILITLDQWEQMHGRDVESPSPSAKKTAHKKTIILTDTASQSPATQPADVIDIEAEDEEEEYEEEEYEEEDELEEDEYEDEEEPTDEEDEYEEEEDEEYEEEDECEEEEEPLAAESA